MVKQVMLGLQHIDSSEKKLNADFASSFKDADIQEFSEN